MKIIFMGTPDFAVPSLNVLVASGHQVVAVYTQPPRRAGRGKTLTPSPVQTRAEALGIDVMTPVTLRDTDTQTQFSGLQADVAVVAAYGLILPQAVLDAPRLGCMNVHASLLPRWRGAAPIQRAILAGDAMTGVTLMQMEAGLDTGPMLATVHTEVENKTAGLLTAELAERGAELLVQVLSEPEAYVPRRQPDAGVTYAAKIDKAEARLDFMISAPQLERQIRAFAPSPGAYFVLDGERFRILAAQAEPSGSARPGDVIDDRLGIQCNPGVIRPLLIQRAGKAAMTPAELLRGLNIPAGTRLG